MQLGCFSVSLAVQDLAKSKAFYEQLGFTVYAGEESHNFLIMKNGETNLGLFQGMFEENILTFNPGWDQTAQDLNEYVDIRELHQKMADAGIAIEHTSMDSESGPGSFTIKDPDGNVILLDQHR
ncbi:MAG: VOC family protein [Gammaproteobacteria bacterium]|nr:VOC family protein [Gammaproteobacteria bacterium]NNJ71862.1 VOC family protein [Enterobacterales bacterium]